MTEQNALDILMKISDKEFDEFLNSTHVPERARMLIKGKMADWKTVLPQYYIKAVSIN